MISILKPLEIIKDNSSGEKKSLKFSNIKLVWIPRKKNLAGKMLGS